METTDKLPKTAINDFDLHVKLIMRQDKRSLSQARVVAWLEGENGLTARLGGTLLKFATA